ncbi:hypothetical protein [Bradyrhizobium arachidis]|uniref:Uncharacterized protein n=1 Tax=Bradyrhizobium arachidis TaxID=858423 RepID=A0AAE7TIH4_9BRAD|nr:hypothetical protein [Bradyrhizobium arachidis]QOZ68906.1 hypothetical protein WN72_23185 [Bradyrhizobium arachidis]SFV19450.1 hypothetical protein SAMN05192541_15131 [Bradyrhizobium arachidis]
MSDHTLGDAPIQPKYREQMNHLARLLDGYFNGDAKGHAREVGFVMMIFDFNEQGRCNYISNANRGDVVTLLKEQLKRFEGQPEQQGNS